MSNFFRVAPGFLRRAFYLIGQAIVGKTLIANRLSNFFLHLAGYLIELAAYLVFIHSDSSKLGRTPCEYETRATVVYLRLRYTTGRLPLMSWISSTTSATTSRIWMYHPIA